MVDIIALICTLTTLLLLAALVAALRHIWKRRVECQRLWQVVQSGDPRQVESARDRVTPHTIPYLMKQYWREPDWSKKRSVVELLQDRFHPDLPKLMLDFLRVPLEPGDEQTQLAQAIALGFIDERYDRYTDYYNDRDLLARDVNAVLREHDLWAEAPSKPPASPVRPAIPLPESATPEQRLLLGIFYDDLPVVEQALRDQANPSVVVRGGKYDGCSALLLAVMFQRYEMAQLLIQQGADVRFIRSEEEQGQTALWWAAHHGHLPLAEEMIRRGAKIDLPTGGGETSLSTAASCGQLAMVRYLVSQGANVHAKLTTCFGGVTDGRKPFHLAVSQGHVAVVEYLIEAGNDVNEAGGSGHTPLMVAAEKNFYDLAGLLIQHGANVNAVHTGKGIYTGLRGYTPLVFAVGAGSVRLTGMLIQAGANVHYRVPAGENWDGKRLPERGLLDFAKGKRAASITKLLREQGLNST